MYKTHFLFRHGCGNYLLFLPAFCFFIYSDCFWGLDSCYGVSVRVPSVVHDAVPDFVPSFVPDLVPGVVPDGVIDLVPDVVSNVVRGVFLDFGPDIVPGVVPDDVPDVILEVVPGVALYFAKINGAKLKASKLQ